MPRSVLTGAKQHKNFQTEYIQNSNKIIDLKGVEPLFNVPTCVILSDSSKSQNKDIPMNSISGKLPQHNIKWTDAKEFLTEEDDIFSILPVGQKSKYFKHILNGAFISPRALWFVSPSKHAKVTDKDIPYLETDSHATELAKVPWNISIEGAVESDFLYGT